MQETVKESQLNSATSTILLLLLSKTLWDNLHGWISFHVFIIDIETKKLYIFLKYINFLIAAIQESGYIFL